DLSRQKRKLLSMLKFVVASLDWSSKRDWKESVDPEEDLALVLLALGRRHTELYAVPEESYAVVGEVLLWVLDKGLGQAFTPPVRDAWTKLYTAISASMRIGGQGADINIDLGRSLAP
ncbi:MAG: globin domain-containing protein, partial [Myxococcota bacterium]